MPFPPPGELPIYINYTTKLRQKVDMQKDNYKVMCISSVQSELSVRLFSQSLSRVRLFATPWTTARQASMSSTNSWSFLKLMSIDSVMPSNHLISGIPFSSCFQSFPASGSFPMSQFFESGGQSIGASASSSVLPMNIQD